MISHDELLSILRYDPESGHFTWLKKMSSRAMPGRRAGSLVRVKKGKIYRDLQISGVRYHEHRLAFFYMTKEWPANQIDHIDADGLNNRWANLRPATQTQNNGNARLHGRNTSGFRGVSFRRDAGKFRAEITANGVYRFLGYFAQAEDAARAYDAAAKVRFGEFARLNFKEELHGAK